MGSQILHTPCSCMRCCSVLKKHIYILSSHSFVWVRFQDLDIQRGSKCCVWFQKEDISWSSFPREKRPDHYTGCIFKGLLCILFIKPFFFIFSPHSSTCVSTCTQDCLISKEAVLTVHFRNFFASDSFFFFIILVR